MAPIELRLGGYQGPASVHTRAGRVLGRALEDELGDAMAFAFDANIVERGRKAADLLTLVEDGELDACYFSSSYLAARVPELGIFDQHFVVPDRERAYAILDGPLGARLTELLAARTGFQALAYWDNGVRHISSASAILEPEDCRGLKLRTLANEAHQRVFRALGFEPRVIDVRDLPAAVADGIVDAQENPLTNIYNFGLHRTHAHVTLTGHLLGVAIVLFNKETVAAWPADIRHGVERALRTATAEQRRFAVDDDRTCAEKLIGEDTQIHRLDPAARRAFADRTRDEVTKTRAAFPADLLELFDAELADQPVPGGR